MDLSNLFLAVFGALGLREVILIFVNKCTNRKADKFTFEKDKFSVQNETIEQLNNALSEQIKVSVENRTKIAEILNCKITLTMENADYRAKNELLSRENKQLKEELREMKNAMEVLKGEIEMLKLKLNN